MPKEHWVETKKECDIDSKGAMTVKWVTLERSKKKIMGWDSKDFLDILLKVVGLFSIAIPIILFSRQQAAEQRKQKALLQTDIYTATSLTLHKLVSKPLSKREVDSLSDKVTYELYPKLALFGSDSLLLQLDNINYNLSKYFALAVFILRVDSIDQQRDSAILHNEADDRLNGRVHIHIDTNKLSRLIPIQMALQISIIDYNASMLAEQVEQHPKKLHQSRSGGFHTSIISSLGKVDSIQFQNLLNASSLKKYEAILRRAEQNPESLQVLKTDIENLKNVIVAGGRDCKSEINALHNLQKKYRVYILRLVQKLDGEFIRSNRFLSSN